MLEEVREHDPTSYILTQANICSETVRDESVSEFLQVTS